jgi:drug/metabolite transporter (DMT)-like permease
MSAQGENRRDKRLVNAAAATTVLSNATSTASSKVKGRFFLTTVAFLYGTLNVSIRFLFSLQNPPSAATISFCRSWLTVACYLPTILIERARTGVVSSDKNTTPPRHDGSKKVPPMWRTALEFASLSGASVGLLMMGLHKTDSALRASFLTQTSVVITPLIAWMAGQSVGATVWAGCFTALAGLLTLSMGEASSGDVGTGVATQLLSLSSGDALVLLGAVCWSTFLFRANTVGIHYPTVPLHALADTFRACLYTMWLTSEVYFRFRRDDDHKTTATALWRTAQGLWPGWRQNPVAWAVLVFSAIGPGALASVLMQKGQKELSAAEATVILCGEPVFTAICAYIFMGEVTSFEENVGGALIFLAAALASGAFDTILFTTGRRQSSKQKTQ